VGYKQDVHRLGDKMDSLAEWLKKIGEVNPQLVELGLERVQIVKNRLNLNQPLCPLVIVGGTNGKGSTVATLEAIYLAQGYKTGVFTSPLLTNHTELIRIQGKEAKAEEFCEAYKKIDHARQEIKLTPFEFHTLAAIEILHQHALDIWILEVGLGGRLDAVNILDADVAVVTSIGIDHTEWLGNTRELIGREKAGIFRHNKPVVCGDENPPSSLIDHATQLSAPFYQQGKDFSYEAHNQYWNWSSKKNNYNHLPQPKLAIQNISTALMTVELLQEKLKIDLENIYSAIKNVTLPGRFEVLPGKVLTIMDVAHNPDGVKMLANNLQQIDSKKIHAVFSMLVDKDIAGSIREIKNKIDYWYVAPLNETRGASKNELQEIFEREKIINVSFNKTISDSYQEAVSNAMTGDVILIFGSFHVVGKIRQYIN
jgi:dihydrofolate synthase / folylpolyglutamate synthase